MYYMRMHRENFLYAPKYSCSYLYTCLLVYIGATGQLSAANEIPLPPAATGGGAGGAAAGGTGIFFGWITT